MHVQDWEKPDLWSLHKPLPQKPQVNEAERKKYSALATGHEVKYISLEFGLNAYVSFTGHFTLSSILNLYINFTNDNFFKFSQTEVNKFWIIFSKAWKRLLSVKTIS